MAADYYKPPDILYWFDTGSDEALETSRRKGREFSADPKDIKATLKQAAQAAAEFGRGAMADFAWRKLDEICYTLEDESFEAITLTTHRRIAYTNVTGIMADKNDKFVIRHTEGSLVIKPVAHLSSGSVKVPIGWKRNDIEVPYLTLVEELAARSGVEITSE
jgi:hypothetical protein